MKNRKLDLKLYMNYRKQRHQKGVHSPRMPYPGFVDSYSESELGYQMRALKDNASKADIHWFDIIRIHTETLNELRELPTPNLP